MLVPIFGLFFCVMLAMILTGDLPLDEVDIELLIALGAVGVIGAVLIMEVQERFKPKAEESFQPQSPPGTAGAASSGPQASP
jgi:hypothetical protein